MDPEYEYLYFEDDINEIRDRKLLKEINNEFDTSFDNIYELENNIVDEPDDY